MWSTCQAERGVIALDDLEVVIKRRHLVHLGHRNVHLHGQHHQVPLVQVAVRVVEQMQIFDQQVAAMAVCRAGADQRADFFQRGVVGLTALELAFAADALTQLIYRPRW
jgi:hypothetical protein